MARGDNRKSLKMKKRKSQQKLKARLKKKIPTGKTSRKSA